MGQMAGIEGQAVRTILWLMRTGNCWLEALHWTMGRGSWWATAWGTGRKTLILVGTGNPDTVFPLSLHQGPPLLSTTGGALGPKAQREGGQEASRLGG